MSGSRWTSAIWTFVISAALVAYVYYGIINIPSDLDGHGDALAIYARRKYTRLAGMVGEYLGLGNRVVLSRTIAPLLALPDYNSSGVQIWNENFGGVGARLYKPLGVVPNGPALLWIHGGGWVTMTVDSDDPLISELAKRLDILIVSIDYRLAPEHPFPIPLEDCMTATLHFLNNAHLYNVNKDRVAIGGASAGGNLAAAVSLKMRDLYPEYKLQQQVLVVPCLQAFDFTTPSYQKNNHNTFLPTYWMIHYWLLYGFGFNGTADLVGKAHENQHTSAEAKVSEFAQYVDHNLLNQKHIHEGFMPTRKGFGDEKIWDSFKDVITNPYYAPLMAHDLKNLPNAYIITAEYDVLRDDGLMYGKRLEKAGNKVIVHNYDRTFHAVLALWKDFGVSKKAMQDLVLHMAQTL